jgi:LacI family transcriptional regulator
MGVTMRDIALRAGVSVSTASRALNHKGDVSPDARARVLAAAHDLNYAANAHARALAGASSHTLGLIFINNGDSFFARMARSVTDVATAHNYSIVACNTNENPAHELQALQTLREKRVDGILIGSIASGEAPIRRLVEEGIPFVLINRFLDDVETDCVYSDNRNGAYQAISYLCRLGHRRIMHVTYPDDRFAVRERLIGYRRALAENGIPYDPCLLLRTDLSLPSLYQTTKDALCSLDLRPTAIFVYNDTTSTAVLKAVHDAGLAVPHDISVVGYDNLDYSAFLDPPLTTVTHAADEIGRMGAEILFEKMQWPQDQPWAIRRVVLQPELVIRQSSEACPHNRANQPETTIEHDSQRHAA